MDGSRLISFLGHSSIHPEFDDFLLGNGFKKRPNKMEASQSVEDKGLGIRLSFLLSNLFDEEIALPKKSEGNFIFGYVQFLDNFTGVLPYGLSWSLAPEELTRILGNPVDDLMFFNGNRLVGASYKKGKAWLYTVWYPRRNAVSRYNLTLSPE